MASNWTIGHMQARSKRVHSPAPRGPRECDDRGHSDGSLELIFVYRGCRRLTTHPVTTARFVANN
jgi:hypothetical protein